MKTKELKKQLLRDKRAIRVRKKLRGSSLKPRMCVVKSNMHIEVQLIDDENGQTLASISTRSKEFKNTEFNKRSKVSARKIGERIAEIAAEKNIKQVVFDRGFSKYHGILEQVGNGARETGLKI